MSPAARRHVIATVLSLFVLFGGATQVVVASYLASHPPVAVPAPNRHAFARVAILLDGTRSIGDGGFELGKKVVTELILPAVSYGDVAVAWDIRPGFDNKANAVFGLSQEPLPRPQQPTATLDILDRHRAGGTAPHTAGEEMYDLIRGLEPVWDQVETVPRVWAAAVEARQPPDHLGSDICGALNEAGRWLAQAGAGSEPWLFALTDLQQTGGTSACHPEQIPKGTRIVLVYSPRVQPADGFLKPFFDDRKVRWVPLSVLAGDLLLPPNPLAQISPRHVPAFVDGVAPRLAPAGQAVGALLAVIWLPVLALDLRQHR